MGEVREGISGDFGILRVCVSRVAAGTLLAALAACSGDGGIQRDFVHHEGKTWMELRFTNMIAQQDDYTCGAASLATILTHYYGMDVSEADVLDLAENEQGNRLVLDDEAEAESVENADPDNVKIEGFTYAHLAEFSRHFGFLAKGIKTDYMTLMNLKRPVIAYLEGDGFNHFVVIRQVTDDWVYVSDPTWGNRRYVRGMFKELWAVDLGDNGKRLGRILAVLPSEGMKDIQTDREFFNPI